MSFYEKYIEDSALGFFNEEMVEGFELVLNNFKYFNSLGKIFLYPFYFILTSLFILGLYIPFATLSLLFGIMVYSIFGVCSLFYIVFFKIQK